MKIFIKSLFYLSIFAFWSLPSTAMENWNDFEALALVKEYEEFILTNESVNLFIQENNNLISFIEHSVDDEYETHALLTRMAYAFEKKMKIFSILNYLDIINDENSYNVAQKIFRICRYLQVDIGNILADPPSVYRVTFWVNEFKQHNFNIYSKDKDKYLYFLNEIENLNIMIDSSQASITEKTNLTSTLRLAFIGKYQMLFQLNPDLRDLMSKGGGFDALCTHFHIDENERSFYF